MFNLINYEPAIDEIYSYAKDPFAAKYQLLINKRECTDLKHLNDLKDFTKYSNNMGDVYKNIEEHKINKKMKNINCIWRDQSWCAY